MGNSTVDLSQIQFALNSSEPRNTDPSGNMSSCERQYSNVQFNAQQTLNCYPFQCKCQYCRFTSHDTQHMTQLMYIENTFHYNIILHIYKYCNI